MTAAKKTTTSAKTAVKAPAKKLTMSLKTGKIAVKSVKKPAPAKKAATSIVDQILKNQVPIIVKADQTKAGPKITKAVKAPKADKGPSKMDAAIALWDSMPKAERKDIIQAFQDKAKLTKAGANTYYALIKAKKAK